MLGRPGQEPITRGNGMGRVIAWIGAVGLLLGGAVMLWPQGDPEAAPAISAAAAAAGADDAAAMASRAAKEARAAAGQSGAFAEAGSSPVIDSAKIFSADWIARIGFQLSELKRVSGPQVVVMSVPSLGSSRIEDYAFRVANQWGIGDEERDDGVLVLIAPNERKVRIEVGLGLEKILTNDLCKKIIDERMLPHFRKGNMEAATQAGVDALAEVLSANPTLPRKVAKP
jgi:uncharacterized protein